MKNIYAITVSKNYPEMLEITVPVNYPKLKKWFIVTQDDDIKTVSTLKKLKVKYPNIEVLYYPLVPTKSDDLHRKYIFTPTEMNDIMIPKWDKNYGSDASSPVFDKGGAIRLVQKFYMLPEDEKRIKFIRNGHLLYNDVKPVMMKSDDIIIILDCDILLPSNVNSIIDKLQIDDNTIHGAIREDCLFYSDSTRPHTGLPYHNWCIDGFFQLYKYNNHRLYKRSYSASVCDTQFAQSFHNKEVIKDIKCKHLGLPRINWNGRENINFIDDRNNDINDLIKTQHLPSSPDVKSNRSYIRNYVRYNIYKGKWWSEIPTQVVYVPGFSQTGGKFLVDLIKQHNSLELYVDEDDNNKSTEFFHKIKQLTSDMNFDINWLFHTSRLLTHKTFVDLKWPVSSKKVTYKYILMTRDPVDRAVSEFRRHLSNMPSSLSWSWASPGRSFEYNIDKELEYLSGINKSNHIKKITESPGSLICDGLYDILAAPLIEHAGEENVMTVSLEKLINNFQNTLDSVFDFLNLPHTKVNNISNTTGSIDNSLISKKSMSSMRTFYAGLYKYDHTD